MSERINSVVYTTPERSSTLEAVETNLFLTQPHELIVMVFRELLLADPQWTELFGTQIDEYPRTDYSIRSLPAMRVYVDSWSKDYETWYESGEVKIDIIWPPSIRRNELQQLPATVAGAMIQQLRRPSFFTAMCAKLPSLNEFGKTVTTDFTLGFHWEDDVLPLTRMTCNFRVLLNDWDDYMESDFRTRDFPFTRTLADLERIFTTIEALRDNGDVELTVGMQQN